HTCGLGVPTLLKTTSIGSSSVLWQFTPSAEPYRLMKPQSNASTQRRTVASSMTEPPTIKPRKLALSAFSSSGAAAIRWNMVGTPRIKLSLKALMAAIALGTSNLDKTTKEPPNQHSTPKVAVEPNEEPSGTRYMPRNSISLGEMRCRNRPRPPTRALCE